MESLSVLKKELTERYGPMISNDNLRLALGYPTMEAFRQSLARKTVPIAVFSIANRRGKFALTDDVAEWLIAQRDSVIQEKIKSEIRINKKRK